MKRAIRWWEAAAAIVGGAVIAAIAVPIAIVIWREWVRWLVAP